LHLLRVVAASFSLLWNDLIIVSSSLLLLCVESCGGKSLICGDIAGLFVR
jgi:hypothetical protein